MGIKKVPYFFGHTPSKKKEKGNILLIDSGTRFLYHKVCALCCNATFSMMNTGKKKVGAIFYPTRRKEKDSRENSIEAE